MTLKQFVSNLFGYRVKEGDEGWDEASRSLAKNGDWSLASSPRKFEHVILELLKRVERLEHERDAHLQPTK